MWDRWKNRGRWRRGPILALIGILAALAGGGLLLRALRGPYHFAAVEPGVLYRSGQLGTADLERVRASASIQTIVDLCVERRESPKALEEQAFVEKHGIRYVHVPVMASQESLEETTRRFLEVVDDPRNRPVLVHCWLGVKRTGVMVAVYKMEYQNVSNEQALAELPAFGRDLEDFVDGEREFVAGYIPRAKRAFSPPVPLPAPVPVPDTSSGAGTAPVDQANRDP
ncbi:MAG TPA: tyrosine-protein phosphatase [Planctomycetota bacterium]|nr:tyrosine-protein phosphatase [Planctomycetota bacterium]